MTRRTLTWAAVVGVITVTATGVVVARRRATPPPADASPAMSGMPGMPGMPDGSPNEMPNDSAGAVRLTSEQVRQFGITFGTVEERTLSTSVRATGVVTVDEGRITTVAPRFGGYVERLLVRTTGERVTRGQALAAIYAPEVLAAAEELLVARRLGASLGTSAVPGVAMPATDLVAAARRRLALLGVSDTEIDAVLRTGRASRTITLRAPVSGIVLEKRVVDGQAVAAGDGLYTVADLASLWVETELRESDAASVHVGTAAEITFAADASRSMTGTVSYVYPTADATTRTVRARIVVANAGGRLRPGMYATVRFTSPSRRALAVPASAIVRTGERTMVFVELGGGRLAPRDVETGRADGDLVEVLAGLARGQRVVTSAQYLLESESNLADVMRSMLGQAGAQDMGGMPGMPGMDMKGADTHGLPPAAPKPNAPRPNAPR